MERDPNLPSYTELNPLKAMRPQLVKKGYIIPACLGILGMFGMMYELVSGAKNEFWFIAACFVVVGELGLIYALCGKRKPWWLMAGTVVATAVLLKLCEHFVGSLNDLLIFKYDKLTVLIGPGIVEELFKSIPVFALAAFAINSRDRWAKIIGVTEPLDGILIGSAAGFGFALAETFLQYSGSGELIMWRFLSDIFGHAAYSGYFGYFIGLAAMRRRDSFRTILIGLGFSFLVHNAWDFFAANEITLGLIPVAVLSYAGFVAAILKARQISPSRSENFATVRIDRPEPPVPMDHARVAEPSTRITLVGLSGPATGQRFRMSPQSVKIGRDAGECQIVLADGSGKISKVHCVVGVDSTGARLFLEDQHSTNGTFLGSGERLLPGQRMHLISNATFYLSTPAVMFQVIAE
jgi:RsiW-degrading membrane proteinase PrsW (M82 family)